MKDYPSKKIIIRACNESSCADRGASSVMRKIKETTGLFAGTENDEFDLDYSACLGCCEFGPNLLVNGNLILGADKRTVMEQIKNIAGNPIKTSKEKMDSIEEALNEI